MSDLVGNPNCWFCHAQAYVFLCAQKWPSVATESSLFRILIDIGTLSTEPLSYWLKIVGPYHKKNLFFMRKHAKTKAQISCAVTA